MQPGIAEKVAQEEVSERRIHLDGKFRISLHQTAYFFMRKYIFEIFLHGSQEGIDLYLLAIGIGSVVDAG